MAEALKDSFGPDVPVAVADMLTSVLPTFDRDGFVAACLVGYDDLELTPRARRIADAMAEFTSSPKLVPACPPSGQTRAEFGVRC